MIAGLAVLLLCTTALAQSDSKRGPSTAEERQRFLAIMHKMEESPLDKNLLKERKWAAQWLVEVPDISVTLCLVPLGDYSKYQYSAEITAQFTFTMAALVIEHPDQAKDIEAQYLAGVEGALKAYQSILKTKPEAKWKALDDLLQKQRDGKLADDVRATSSAGCK